MKSFFNLLLVLIIASGCLFGAYYFGKDTPGKLISWKWANGKFVGYKQDTGNKYKNLRIRFTYNTKVYEFTSNMNIAAKKYVPNGSIGVIFPEGSPDKAEARDYSRLLLMPTLLLVAGLVMGLIGVVGMSRLIRGRNVSTGQEV